MLAEHSQYITQTVSQKKVNQNVFITKAPQDVLRMTYFAFVHSNLLYGIEVYANTTANHLSKLIVLNNKLLCIFQHKSIKSHSIDLYITYSTLPIQLLRNYQILIFTHKYVYNKSVLSNSI